MTLGRPKVALMLTDERVQVESLAHRSRTAPHVIPDVQIAQLVTEITIVGQAKPNPIHAGDVQHTDTVSRREVVGRLPVDRIPHRHPTNANIFGHEIEHASPSRHHPGAASAGERALSDSPKTCESERDAP